MQYAVFVQKDIQTELERTGLTRREFGHLLAEDHRGRIDSAVIRTLLDGQHLSAYPQAWGDILDILKDLPDGAPKPGSTYSYTTKRMPLTEEMTELINTEFKRTQISITDVARRIVGTNSFQALNNRIVRWGKGTAETVPISEWQDVVSYLDSLPDAVYIPDPKRERMPPALPEAPEKHIAKIAKPKPPQKPSTITNTDDSRAKPDLTLERIPPIKPRPDLDGHRLSSSRKRLGYVVIDEEQFQRLHAERERTLVSVRRLVASASNAPAGLQSRTVDNWFHGTILSAEKEHLDWVLDTYSKLPSVNEF